MCGAASLARRKTEERRQKVCFCPVSRGLMSRPPNKDLQAAGGFFSYLEQL